MTRKQKPSAYTVTVEDVASVVAEHACEWGATAYFVITLGKPTGPAAYVEVTLRDGVYTPGGKELARYRWPLDERHAERWPANILHAVMHAYAALEGDPWLWPERKRKALVQDV